MFASHTERAATFSNGIEGQRGFAGLFSKNRQPAGRRVRFAITVPRHASTGEEYSQEEDPMGGACCNNCGLSRGGSRRLYLRATTSNGRKPGEETQDTAKRGTAPFMIPRHLNQPLSTFNRLDFPGFAGFFARVGRTCRSAFWSLPNRDRCQGRLTVRAARGCTRRRGLRPGFPRGA